ncbi:MAG: FAD-dependent oxidoreductase [Lachnospiraceae bacterium]|nr:FAD-dependent oxidoreductase [Lachnospiraceae bacterium]
MRYLILGAGPAGLSFACALKNKGQHDFLVLEQEEEAGGLCRSAVVDGFPFDTGGGHFLDVRNRTVLEFLFFYLPFEEWDEYERDSRIEVKGHVIGSPIEANIWQLPQDMQVEYLKAIAVAGCNLGTPMPEKFTDWIDWKLGKRIAEDYMLPYNRKMFGSELDSLGTYWLEKLPDVSFDETLLSCLNRKPYGKQPAHARFFYPKKYGYGELWKRMAESLGDKIRYGTKAGELNFEERSVNGEFEADRIVITVPWTALKLKGKAGETVKDALSALKHTSVVTEYHPENLDSAAHWIYYPDPALEYHRILLRHNFVPGGRGYWTETNETRYSEKKGMTAFHNEYAYPLNTVGKQEKIAYILKEAEKHGIYGLGRWGEWQHFNSDVVVDRALKLAARLCG